MHYQSLADTCRRIKSGEQNSEDVTQHILSRIGTIDGELGSYAMVLAESAMEQARVLDKRQQAGEVLGALHGVPIAIKDLLFTKGIATASGTRVMRDFVPEYSATVVERLIAAGAVIVGKTQLTEGAFGSHHPDIVAPKNPYDLNAWSGVSSSGSGVSVAAGLAYGALGTDTGGSIRFPSASCGLVGLKPTYGRVSRYGAFPLAESLDHIGPMTRTVEDAARILSVIAGYDQNDSSSSKAVVPNYLSPAVSDMRGMVVGYDPHYNSEGIDPQLVAMLQDLYLQLQALGAELVEVQLPSEHKQLVADWGITCAVECARAHAEYYPRQKEMYGPNLARLLELGHSVPEERYAELQLLRAVFRTRLNHLFKDIDLLISPCMISLPPSVAAMEDTVSDTDETAEFITFTAPFDYSGHPTLTLPAGLSESGLPQSFQLIGRELGEAELIQAGMVYESEFGAMPHPAKYR